MGGNVLTDTMFMCLPNPTRVGSWDSEAVFNLSGRKRHLVYVAALLKGHAFSRNPLLIRNSS